ncbi:MAG: CRISPR-associated RAMP Cmr6 [uncultured Sulfurovum sp.]|uniref:CRISPR-associated RAMP Cmr6 n=1 Tax=uncultured Sulfurovum sp. TaxID=269237 RepID=A0A6S6SK71_9BACT|nr:MAG: CRISPR-associated RAMP Cmr6 [uncultured Sulfurovum sp.]
MSKANIGWLFYKKMYAEGENKFHIETVANEILSINTNDESLKANYGFRLETTYPGLLIGSGYMHGISVEKDFKIGFYFDHTTGLPLIQGTSVKGVLRSCFPMNGESDPYKKEKDIFIKECIGRNDLNVEALITEIFEGIDHQTGKPKSIYERDIFYEARVVQTNGSLLHDDYLAPHGDNLLKNPLPLRFLKVAPNVHFEFNFDLKDGFISADEKEKLFLDLLLMFGIGAKTNVGYGQFRSWTQEEYNTFVQKQERRKKAEEKKGLSGFKLLIKELEDCKKKDNNMVKKIKNYDEVIEDVEEVKEIVNSKNGDSKFHNRIMKYLDTLN